MRKPSILVASSQLGWGWFLDKRAPVAEFGNWG